MVKFYLSILFLLMMEVGASQQPVLEWAKAFLAANNPNSTALSNGRSVAVDQQGNVYTAGYLHETVDFDPGPGSYPLTAGGQFDRGIYISKLSPTGEFIWAKQIPVLIEFASIEITLDQNGNVYLTSDFRHPADMDPGPGILILTPGSWKDAFVIKLNPNGDLVWVKQFGGSQPDTGAFGTAITIDQNGNVIFCGAFNRTVDFDPGPNTFNLTSTGNFEAFITKLSSSGDLIWARKLGNFNSPHPSVEIKDVKCDASGNVYSTGYFSGDCDFDPGPANYNFVAGGPCDGFISKLDVNGNFVLAKKIGHSLNNHVVQPRGIDIDPNNNIYTAGAFIGTQDFDPGVSVHNVSSHGGTQDTYILKLNAQGDFVWVLDIGGNEYDIGADLAIGNDNNIYAFGIFNGTIDFNTGSGTFQINNLYDETVLTKFTADGVFVYAAPFFSSAGHNLGSRIVTDPSINIYVTGYLSGTTDFDPGPNVYNVTGNSTFTPFVVKLSKCANITTSTLIINTCNSYALNSETFDSTGTYTQVIPNASGCDSIITLHLTVNRKFIDQAKSICEGDFFFAGGANQNTSGVYKDTLQTSFGCDSIITTHLTVNPKPAPNLGPDRDICMNTQFTASPGSFASYLWQDMSTQSNFKINTAGLFWVTVTNAFNCSFTDSIRIHAIVPNPVNFLKPTDSICLYDQLQLQSLNNFNSYHWSTGQMTNRIVINTPGQYWLRVTDAMGCTGTDTITVFPKECISGVLIPTAFTPNGDGKNDYFGALVYGKILSFKLQVFDRAGQIIFQTTNPSRKWDGLYKGIPYSTSVLVWQCFYQLENFQPEYKKGTVTLIR